MTDPAAFNASAMLQVLPSCSVALLCVDASDCVTAARTAVGSLDWLTVRELCWVVHFYRLVVTVFLPLLLQVGDFGLSRLATAAGCSDDSSSTPAAAAVAGATAVRLGGCSYKAAPTPAPIRTRAVGTVHWMPPEVMRGLPQGPPVDVFAFGIVLYELAAEALPYLRPRDTPLHQPQQEHQQHIDRTNVWLPPPGDICAAVLRGERPDERLILPMCPPVLR